MPRLRDTNNYIQKLKASILEACRAYYSPDGDEEPLYTDVVFDMLVRQLYRTTYKKVSHYTEDSEHSPMSEHYIKWLEHMSSRYGFGFK